MINAVVEGGVVRSLALAATGIEQAWLAVARGLGSTFNSDRASILPSGIYT